MRASLSEGLEAARSRVGELEAELEATKPPKQGDEQLAEDGSATLKDGAVDACGRRQALGGRGNAV